MTLKTCVSWQSSAEPYELTILGVDVLAQVDTETGKSGFGSQKLPVSQCLRLIGRTHGLSPIPLTGLAS
eukprot:7379851-Prymnesium_polylepis.7